MYMNVSISLPVIVKLLNKSYRDKFPTQYQNKKIYELKSKFFLGVEKSLNNIPAYAHLRCCLVCVAYQFPKTSKRI